MKISSLIGGLALTALLAGAAFAQAPAPAGAAPNTPPPQPPDVKQVGDWQVRCFHNASSSPCDMLEQVANKDTQQRILSFALSYVPHLNQHVVVIVVPIGINIPKGVLIKTASYTSKPLPYRYCDRSFCYVQALTDNDIADQLGRAGDKATVEISATNGKNYDLPLSLNGFTAAHDSMAEQAKQKAVNSPPAAPAAAPAK
ncbi:MAG TPA: invasion associated locus B family protein [Rhizomicrobium sp.]|jgi:invasion protein IalB|nr:invasion associated locus B family protein [Rhizomicrobium sp.]